MQRLSPHQFLVFFLFFLLFIFFFFSEKQATCSHLRFYSSLLSHLLGHGQAQICACHPCTKRQDMLIFSVSFQLPTTYHMGVSAMTEV